MDAKALALTDNEIEGAECAIGEKKVSVEKSWKKNTSYVNFDAEQLI